MIASENSSLSVLSWVSLGVPLGSGVGEAAVEDPGDEVAVGGDEPGQGLLGEAERAGNEMVEPLLVHAEALVECHG